jgi:hypothetical protein
MEVAEAVDPGGELGRLANFHDGVTVGTVSGKLISRGWRGRRHEAGLVALVLVREGRTRGPGQPPPVAPSAGPRRGAPAHCGAAAERAVLGGPGRARVERPGRTAAAVAPGPSAVARSRVPRVRATSTTPSPRYPASVTVPPS